MDKTTRYNLLSKLSEFYVKEVNPNIAGFNKARILSNASIFVFWLVWFYLTFLSLFFLRQCAVLSIVFANDAGAVFIGLCLVAFCVVAVFIITLRIAKKIDKNNIIRIFNHSGNGSIMPVLSADSAIKKYLMPSFLNFLGTFNWTKDAEYINTRLNNEKYIDTLKILNVPFLEFDGFFTGTYHGVKINAAEPFISIVRPRTFVCLGFVLYIIIGAFENFAFVPKIFVSLSFLFVLALIILIIRYWYITSKIFRGLLVEIDMNKEFYGHTFILERNNIKDNKMIDTAVYSEVKLEDAEFEKEFRVWSQNRFEAGYILTTAFLERIKAIKHVFKAKYVRVSFKDKKMIIAIHTGRDMFQTAGANSMTKETFIQIFDEICEILDLVDILKLNEKLGL